ncbi:uncharacterized protein LOC129226201 [Uloborus diversus]|uniref:uncharacterized protein LOC129226201 n=1 Tax=Uloborus diversus TaxID=327109 RepID=UPI002409E01C|nr:uncharacterized protein LOC129226201 [Uloborus diversus]
MGSSSQQQHYRDPVSTVGSENDTEREQDATVTETSAPWLPERDSPGAPALHAQLGWLWEVHGHGLASLFAVLALLSLFTALRLRAQLSARPHLSSLCVFLGLMAGCRLVVLFVDPYGAKQSLPPVLLRVLWDLGYPCLVSGFALLQLALVRATRLKMTRMDDESLVSIVITLHFCLVITAGVLAAIQHSLRIIWLIVQVCFLVWGGFLCLSSFLDCLRVLRSIVKVPRRVLTQVDPGYEINSIMPQSMFSETTPPQEQPHGHQPRIHITDENDQTYSYASEGSLGPNKDQQRPEAFPLRCLPGSPTRWKFPEPKSKPTSPNEDPALIRPLMSPISAAESHVAHQTLDPSTVAVLQPTISSPRSSISPSASAREEEFRRDLRRLKRPSHSRLERQVRRLFLTSILGMALCLLEAYHLFGPIPPPSASVVPWFCLQSLGRIVEFSMAYSMVCMSQQSLTSRYYYYPS